jgi:outer membrane immunogenic protein
MKKALLAAAATACLLSWSAQAADLTPRLKALPPIAAFSWTGCYVGGHVGWLSGTSSVTDEAYYDSGATTQLKADSFAGGGQIGCNWQDGSWVWGAEADATFASADRSFLGYYAQYSTKWDAVGTLRGKMGLAVDRTLVYVTAGAAWADVKTTYDTSVPSGGGDGLVSSDNRWGWTVGVGVERAFTPNWSVKLEALYIRLVDEDRVALPGTTCSTTSGPDHACTFAFDHEAWTVRLGVNYRWN